MNGGQEHQPSMPGATGALADHAVVIGSGIGGLLAARVLTDYVRRVTIVERDPLPQSPVFRRGVPQARHAHTLMPRGQAIFERHFPGLMDDLLANGATAVDASRDVAFYQDGMWRSPRPGDTQASIVCSRPLLDVAVYRRVTALSNVDILSEYTTEGLIADDGRVRVTGVRLRTRGVSGVEERVVPADLVIDASGRQSHAPRWLYNLGCAPPEEWTINSFVGYVTRIYRRPAGFDEGWKSLYVRPTPAESTRGGVILPLEGDRWHVTLIGVAGDFPPADEAGFLPFAQSLPTPRLYDAIKHAEPLTQPTGYRRTSNRVRRYDKLPRYLEGFLVFGDAVYVLNPMYAQGMTAAAIGSMVLDECLREPSRAAGDMTGLASTFHERLSKALAGLWRMATTKDWDWPLTEVTDTIFASA